MIRWSLQKNKQKTFVRGGKEDKIRTGLAQEYIWVKHLLHHEILNKNRDAQQIRKKNKKRNGLL